MNNLNGQLKPIFETYAEFIAHNIAAVIEINQSFDYSENEIKLEIRFALPLSQITKEPTKPSFKKGSEPQS